MNKEQKAFAECISALDESEYAATCAIMEHEWTGAKLFGADVAATATSLANKIATIRTTAFRKSFKTLRASLPEDAQAIGGRSIAAWAKAISDAEAMHVKSILSVAIAGGADAAEISHKVCGGANLRGSNGATQKTRHMIQTLSHSLSAQRRKTNETINAPLTEGNENG
jgi:hypothetical protein